MSEATDLAAAASSTDARVGLRAVLALRRLAEHLELLQVTSARRQGWSWQEIADALAELSRLDGAMTWPRYAARCCQPR